MLTRSMRRQIEEEEKGSNSNDNHGPSTSTIKNDEEEGGIIDQGILEQATVEHYRKVYGRKNVPKVSMIVYRMNVWKNNKKGPGKTLNQYKGRKDFGVEIEFGSEKSYKLFCYDKTVAPIKTKTSHRFPCEKEPPSRRLWGRQPADSPHCKITGPNYLDDFIWIEDMQTKHGTFVNGKRIPRGEMHRLVDGDIIGLRAPHDSTEHFWGENKLKRGFVFKVKSLSKDCNADEENATELIDNEPNPAYLALNNVVIMDEILKFLNFHELKTARVVNKFWKDSATRLVDLF